MAAEVRRVHAAVQRLAPPHAFSHNDLLSGNILVSTLVRLPRPHAFTLAILLFGSAWCRRQAFPHTRLLSAASSSPPWCGWLPDFYSSKVLYCTRAAVR